MAFLAELKTRKTSLKHVTTRVTDPATVLVLGEEERVDGSACLEDLERESSASRAEILAEMMWRARWVATGNTLRCSTRACLEPSGGLSDAPAASASGEGDTKDEDEGDVRIAVFMKEGKQQEHASFDTFAYLLCGEKGVADGDHNSTTCNFVVEQVDVDDIREGKLTVSNYSGVIFPGGSIFEVEETVGDSGADAVASFVAEGGAYWGACAGGFLASRRGYDRCRSRHAILGTQTGWVKGTGRAVCDVADHKASEILGAATPSDLYFANGACFEPCDGQSRSAVAECSSVPTVLSACIPLLQYRRVKTDCSDVDFTEADSPPRYAAVAGFFGSGRVVAFGPHPEASGKSGHKLVRHSLLWALGRV